jgi:hypothetical protein
MAFKASSKDECEKALKQVENLSFQCQDLSKWKLDHEEMVMVQEKAIDLQVRCQENEKTITDLKEKLKNLLTQRQPLSLQMPV